MISETYIIYNETELPKLGTGVRRITVKESKKFAYIKGFEEEDRIKLKLTTWLDLKTNRFKIQPDCKNGVHNLCKCVTSYGSNINLTNK